MNPISDLIWQGLNHLGLSGVAANVRNRLQVAGLIKWKPLVPPDAFTDCTVNLIRALDERGQSLGAYVEFGVSRGTSMACSFKALKQTGHDDVRLVGFDSFEGMPPGSESEGWQTGDYRSTIEQTRAHLENHGADNKRIELVKGWFSDTCNDETRKRLGLDRVSIAMIDCDIYSATVEALDFVGPMLTEHAVLIFDDWGWMEDKGAKGQKEAFNEFIARHAGWQVSPFPAYRPEARVFLLKR